MKCSVDAKAFSQGLEQLEKVLKGSPIPILDEVCVRIQGGTCTMVATDLNTWLVKSIPAQGDEFSFVLCETGKLTRICKHFNGELSLEWNTAGDERYPLETLTLRCGCREGTFRVQSAEDYPKVPEASGNVCFSANARTLSQRVERVRYATDRSEKCRRISAACIQLSGKQVYAVDGYRAACDTDDSLEVQKPFMVRAEVMDYLKLFGDAEVSFRLNERYGQAVGGNFTMFFRLEKEMPYDLQSVIPQVYREEFYVSPKEFLRELKYMKAYVTGKRGASVRFSGGELSMPDVPGQCCTKIRIEGESRLVFGFNYRYMEDAIRQFEEEACVRVKVSGYLSPIIVEAEGHSDFALLLPVRLKEEREAA